MSQTQQRQPSTGSDWWTRRPRRSERDRKVAGVAGGLARAFGIDPILLRVGFVVLTIFGGVGLVAYVLGWLLLPSDSDEVSAAEALIGKGQSSVSPILAVGLAIVALASIGTSFSWGLPFLPLVGLALLIFFFSHKKRGHAGPKWDKHWQQAQKHWEGINWGKWGCGDHDSADHNPANKSRANQAGAADPASPFDQPAFWDRTDPGPAEPADADPAQPPRQTPPAWDPLGAAPFAWDLPEVDLTPPPPPAPKRSVIAAVTLPLAFIAGAVAAAGVVYRWWSLSWAEVSGIALAVVALGTLLAALRGRGGNLVGPGIVLSIVTAGLAITGLSGTDGYGSQQWTPTSSSQLRPEYRINAGESTLDLRQITLAKTETKDVTVSIGAGDLSVYLPPELKVNLSCIATAGEARCLNVQSSGLNLNRDPITTNQVGSADSGTLNLTVLVGAGVATVSHG